MDRSRPVPGPVPKILEPVQPVPGLVPKIWTGYPVLLTPSATCQVARVIYYHKGYTHYY